MTGGQTQRRRPHGADDRRAGAAEGVKRVVVVTDEPQKYPPGIDWPQGVTVHHRDELQAVQKELREIPGVTVLIYDQTCAAEKRRRRKRGTFPDPDKRVFINELVCEGCGDCGVKSNCVSVQPLETEFGRKRTIDQSACNKDFSCLKGFCPSFVTVHGAQVEEGQGRRAATSERAGAAGARAAEARPDLQHHRHRRRRHRRGHHRRHPRHGGASRRQGRRRHRHGRPRAEGRRGRQPHADRRAARGDPRHPRRGAAAPTWCSAAISWWPATRRCWRRCKPGTRDGHQHVARFLPGDFTRNADFSLPTERLKRAIAGAGGQEHTPFHRRLAARHRAVRQLARRQHLHARLRLSAWRAAASADAIEQAIELNGAAVQMNLAAFHWGRRAALDRDAVEALARPKAETATRTARCRSRSRRRSSAASAFLTAYQDAALCRALPRAGRAR